MSTSCDDTDLGRDGYSYRPGRIFRNYSAKKHAAARNFRRGRGISNSATAKRRPSAVWSRRRKTCCGSDILAELDAAWGPSKPSPKRHGAFLRSPAKKTLEVSVWMHTSARCAAGRRRSRISFFGRAGIRKRKPPRAAARRRLYEGDRAWPRADGKGGGASRRRGAGDPSGRRGRGAELAFAKRRRHHERAIEEAKAAIAQSGRSQEDILADIKTADDTIARLTAENTALAAGAGDENCFWLARKPGGRTPRRRTHFACGARSF